LSSDAALELVRRDREFADPGHEVPWDDGAGLAEYADAVVDAIGDAKDLVLVAQSFGGFTAPLVCERVPVDLMVLVAAMIPVPGEAASGYWRTLNGRRRSSKLTISRE
jgi:alpha-beta hydrolase superfamily lysophospholipase